MRAPVSWIRDYRRPARRRHRRATSPRRLTALGLKLEALERPGHDITGPLVVGRVLSLDEEPQKQRQDHPLVPVDVGDANGTGRAAGHRLRRPQLRGRRPGRGPARRRAARRLRDLRAQDLRPRLRRHDLLGRASSVSATTTTASSCCRPTPVEPGDDAFDVLPLRDEVIEFEINPDRAYALSLRGVAREAALGVRRRVPRPRRPARSPSSRRGRLPGRGRRPGRLPGVRGPHGHAASTRPPPPPAGWPGGSSWPACGRSRWPSTSPTT